MYPSHFWARTLNVGLAYNMIIIKSRRDADAVAFNNNLHDCIWWGSGGAFTPCVKWLTPKKSANSLWIEVDI